LKKGGREGGGKGGMGKEARIAVWKVDIGHVDHLERLSDLFISMLTVLLPSLLLYPLFSFLLPTQQGLRHRPRLSPHGLRRASVTLRRHCHWLSPFPTQGISIIFSSERLFLLAKLALPPSLPPSLPPQELRPGVPIPYTSRLVIDATQMANLKELPDSLAVIGGGVISVEYATVFAALGLPTSLLCREEAFLPFLPKELQGAIKADMARNGIEVIHNPVSRFEVGDDKMVHVPSLPPSFPPSLPSSPSSPSSSRSFKGQYKQIWREVVLRVFIALSVALKSAMIKW